MGKSATFGMQFFGAWAWHAGGAALPRLRSRQGQWLLALLVLKRAAPVERAWLAAALWPESDDAQALYNLRRNLSDLRRALGAEARRLRAPTPRTLALDLSGADCDLVAFDEAIRRGDAASLEAAAALYRGPLLPGCLEDWAAPERAAREEAVLAGLEALAGWAAEGGGPAAGTSHLRRALEIDPLREGAVRGLMRALAAGGGHAAAAETYIAFRRRLHGELNAEPDAQTVALFRRLRAEGRRAAGAVPAAAAVCPPPPAAPAAGLGRLPAPLTPLIGRAAEVAAAAAGLDRSRLVTLTGIGGIGKTRLALAVAQEVGEEFPAGAWFVDLSPLSDPALTVQAVLSALGVREQPGRTPWETLAEHLRPKRLLLVLDNCEHLVLACARLARGLLQECPALHILATSRESLQLTGEAAQRVPPLSLPGVGPQAGVGTSEAVRLFAERAAGADPAFTLTPQNREAVAHVCRRLDGIPLAIEMAAARVRAMTAAQIAARLDDRFGLLAAPRGETLARQQTLRAAMDWSYDLLNAEERSLLACVSVFASGWTLEAAEAVCAAGGRGGACQVLDLLSSLVDKSLVVFEAGTGGGRYHLLETVRQYGQDRLWEGSAAAATGRAHRDYFLAHAERARAHLAGPAEAEWLDRLEAEHDNLRAALAWSQAGGPDRAALPLAGALSRFWRVRGHLSEGRAFLSAALQANRADPACGAWRDALRGEAHLALAQGHIGEALGLFERALAAAQGAGDRMGEAAALGGLGTAHSDRGEFGTAGGLLARALSLSRELGDRAGQATHLGGLGYLAREAGDYGAAEALLTEAVALSREQGDGLQEGSSLGSLAYVLLHRGDREGARRLLERTLFLYRGFGNRLGEAWTLNSLGNVAAEGDDLAGAVPLVRQALDINRSVGNRAGEAWNLRCLGRLQARGGHHAAATATLQEALRLDREIGNRDSQAWTLHQLGDAARGAGDGAAARGFYAASLVLMRELDSRSGMVTVLEAMAALLDDAGEGERAARLRAAATPEQACDDALAGAGAPSASAALSG